MTIPILFFICLAVAIVGIIIAGINVATAIPRAFNSGNPMSIIVVHIIAALMYGIGGIGALCFGIAWIVTYLKH